MKQAQVKTIAVAAAIWWNSGLYADPCDWIALAEATQGPTTAQSKRSFAERHPKLWKLRNTCRFMLPVVQFTGGVANTVLPFVVRR